MECKPLNGNGEQERPPATKLKPADFPLGSPQSRAAARAMLQARKAQDVRDKIWERCGQNIASFEAGPLLWLTEYTYTEDTHWLKKGTNPIARFPKKDFFVDVADKMLKDDLLFIPKSREMMTSWLSCGYISWMTQWFPKIQWVMQTEKEDKVIELVNYCRILYLRQDDWMQERNPLIVDNTTHLKRANGSEIIGVPKGANQFRLYHPYGVMFDEAAFLPEFMAAYSTVKPVAKRILAVSSAAPGAFADECEQVGEE
jgi:hypothetical protein